MLSRCSETGEGEKEWTTDMGLNEQPRMRFAALPTPLQAAGRLSEMLGGPRILIKRDDLTGLALGGNKTRKLEYLIADAVQAGATHIITAGAAQSNHARQTAAAARLAGMQPVLVLSNPDDTPDVQGNLLLDHLLGADVHIEVTSGSLNDAIDRVAADLRDGGHTPYVIPIGGSNGIGGLGYVAAMLELSHQLWEQNLRPKAMYFASGSGGTQGGIVVGAQLYGIEAKLIGVSVGAPRDAALARIQPVAAEIVNLLGVSQSIDTSLSVFDFDDGHVGEGYGIATEGCLEAIQLLAHTEGIFLDPVYSGKAFAAMVADIRAGQYAAEDTVVFLHTGGAPALFAKREQMAPLLT